MAEDKKKTGVDKSSIGASKQTKPRKGDGVADLLAKQLNSENAKAADNKKKAKENPEYDAYHDRVNPKEHHGYYYTVGSNGKPVRRRLRTGSGYEEADVNKQKGFSQLVSERMMQGQGIKDSLKGGGKDLFGAYMTSLKKLKDPMNYLSKLPGGLGKMAATAYGTKMGRAKEDITYYTGVHAPDPIDEEETPTPPSSGEKPTKTYTKKEKKQSYSNNENGGASTFLDVIAKNTTALIGMSRDMNVIRQNIAQLLKHHGVDPATSADAHMLKEKELAEKSNNEMQEINTKNATNVGGDTSSTQNTLSEVSNLENKINQISNENNNNNESSSTSSTVKVTGKEKRASKTASKVADTAKPSTEIGWLEKIYNMLDKKFKAEQKQKDAEQKQKEIQQNEAEAARDEAKLSEVNKEQKQVTEKSKEDSSKDDKPSSIMSKLKDKLKNFKKGGLSKGAGAAEGAGAEGGAALAGGAAEGAGAAAAGEGLLAGGAALGEGALAGSAMVAAAPWLLGAAAVGGVGYLGYKAYKGLSGDAAKSTKGSNPSGEVDQTNFQKSPGESDSDYQKRMTDYATKNNAQIASGTKEMPKGYDPKTGTQTETAKDAASKTPSAVNSTTTNSSTTSNATNKTLSAKKMTQDEWHKTIENNSDLTQPITNNSSATNTSTSDSSVTNTATPVPSMSSPETDPTQTFGKTKSHPLPESRTSLVAPSPNQIAVRATSATHEHKNLINESSTSSNSPIIVNSPKTINNVTGGSQGGLQSTPVRDLEPMISQVQYLSTRPV